MKFTVVTVCFNAVDTIADTVASVRVQSHPDVEHLIIDGGSTDGTLALLGALKNWGDCLVSEPDKGLYDAMNKGLARASGSYVGFLNADDYFAHPHVITELATAAAESDADIVCGDVRIVGAFPNRHYSGRGPWMFKLRMGHMPPHPALYAKTERLRGLDGFKDGYRIGADFDLILRLFLGGARLRHVPGVKVEMRVGGVSNSGLQSRRTINTEILRSLRENGLRANALQIWSKYLFKVFQFRPGKGRGTWA